MSMLAEPRRKQRVVNLRAGDSAWSKDPDKFGQKLLERWGWEAGRGLGAREDGVRQHVVARYKNDDRGLGYEERTDQWTQHEDQFNQLLANLSSGSTTEDKLHSGVSLEVKSKKSKARVHYHKFTRGKDLSRYSDKDLANIFGKKSLKTKDVDKQDEKSKNIANGEEPIMTAQVFKEGGNMDDYFKNKLKLLGKTVPSVERDDGDVDYSFKGFSGGNEIEQDENVEIQQFGFKAVSFHNENKSGDSREMDTAGVVSGTEGKENSLKKNKKRKKNNIVAEVNDDNMTSTEVCHDITEVNELVVKKDKKKKKSTDTISENETAAPKKNKRKKTEIALAIPNNELPESDEIAAEVLQLQEHATKNAKKIKNKSKSSAIENKSTEVPEEAPIPENSFTEVKVTSKKKKSKRKLKEMAIQTTEAEIQLNEQPSKKKQKKEKNKHL